MTKKELISQAYSKFAKVKQEMIDCDGWCLERKNIDFEEIKKSTELHYHDMNPYLWRPSSLKGIDNNNGWIVITKTEDVLLETDKHEVYDKYGHIHVCYSYETLEKWRNDEITCYRPIQKSTHPLFTKL